jgi:hypothetical protein
LGKERPLGLKSGFDGISSGWEGAAEGVANRLEDVALLLLGNAAEDLIVAD